VLVRDTFQQAWDRLRTSAARANGQAAPAGDLLGYARRLVERVRAGLSAGKYRLSPWAENYTDETAEIRAAYRKLLNEPTLKAAHHTKVLSVAAQDVQVQPAEDDDDPRAEDVARFCRFALRQMDGGTCEAIRAVLAGALLDGYSACTLVMREEPVRWGRWAGKLVPRCIKPYDTARMDLEVDEFRNVTGVWADDAESGKRVLFPASEFVIFSHLSLYHDPGGISDHRAPYRAAWLKNNSWQFRGLHLEKMSSPFLLGTYTSADVQASLEAAMEEAKSHTWCSVPQGALVEAVEFGTRGTADYEAAIRDLDREMLVGTVGAYLPFLEGQTPDGRGDTKVSQNIIDLFGWYYTTGAAGVLTRQVGPRLTEPNFAGASPPEFTLGGLSDAALIQRAKLETELQKQGLPLSKKAAYGYYGVQPPDPEDPGDALGAPPAAPAPAPPFAEPAAGPDEDMPVWLYAGVPDGRQGADHEAHFGKYFPSSVPFAQVRGPRWQGCRCRPVRVTRAGWRKLKAAGARIAEGYEDPAGDA
jgi:hypothetical protein